MDKPLIKCGLIIGRKKFIKYDDKSKNYPMDSPHYHNYYEIYFMLKGKCKFSIEDRFFELRNNNMLIIPPGLIHKAEDYPEMSKRIILNFSSECIANEFQKKLSAFRKSNFYVPQNPSLVLTTLESIRKELLVFDELSEHLTTCYLSFLLEYIIRNETAEKYAPSQSASLELTERLIKFISQNYHNDISLKDLSNNLNYSVSYISSLFKQNMGIGFNKYLTVQRLKSAEYMLSTTTEPISTIATKCGFNDSNYFSLIFKKTYGLAPTEYRNLRKLNN